MKRLLIVLLTLAPLTAFALAGSRSVCLNEAQRAAHHRGNMTLPTTRATYTTTPLVWVGHWDDPAWNIPHLDAWLAAAEGGDGPRINGDLYPEVAKLDDYLEYPSQDFGVLDCGESSSLHGQVAAWRHGQGYILVVLNHSARIRTFCVRGMTQYGVNAIAGGQWRPGSNMTEKGYLDVMSHYGVFVTVAAHDAGVYHIDMVGVH